MNSFGGENSRKLQPRDLLPNPHLIGQQTQRISRRTVEKLVKLIQGDRLPGRVVAAAQALEEVASRLQGQQE